MARFSSWYVGRRASAARLAAAAAAIAAAVAAPVADAAPSVAPGGPGAPALWTPADKVGFGTSTTQRSKVGYTLRDGELTEVYYPDLGTPSVRDLQFVVSDGRTFAERESDAPDHRVQLVDRRSLTYRQVTTDRSRGYRITKTYVTDPARSTLLVKVRFQSLSGRKLQLYALYDPSLSNGGDDDSGSTSGSSLVTSDAKAASVR